MKASDLRAILQDRTKIAYIVAFSVLAIFAYTLLVKNDIGSFRRLTRDYNEAGSSLLILKKTGEYSSYMNRFNSQFIVEKDATWLIELITELAKSEGVNIGLIRPMSAGKIQGYRIVRVMADGRAPYQNMLGFISKLENHEKYIFIEEFGLFAEEPTSAEEMGQQDAAQGSRIAKFNLNAAFFSRVK